MSSEPIRVMVVDDAVVVRGQLVRWIELEPNLTVVGSLRSGREAIEQLDRVAPDVIILDVDMPDTDGITALPFLLKKNRDVVIIMASTLTRRNAEISLRALALGAADYVPKPGSLPGTLAAAAFRRELIEKIKTLGLRAQRRAAETRRPLPAVARTVQQPPIAEPELRKIASPALVPAHHSAELSLRPFSATPPRVLLIGCSTGGPQALNLILPQIASVVDQAPVLIVQHMPPTFTTILAEHLSRASGRPAREAENGEEIRAGQIYLAPGGRHLRVTRRNGSPIIAIDDSPPVNFCKPAVDPLFESAAEVWGGKNLGVILTGMGSDGTRGSAELVAAGGAVIAQDEHSSVVWGMPGSVAHAGHCSAVLPLQDIAARIVRLFAGSIR